MLDEMCSTFIKNHKVVLTQSNETAPQHQSFSIREKFIDGIFESSTNPRGSTCLSCWFLSKFTAEPKHRPGPWRKWSRAPALGLRHCQENSMVWAKKTPMTNYISINTEMHTDTFESIASRQDTFWEVPSVKCQSPATLLFLQLEYSSKTADMHRIYRGITPSRWAIH